MLPGVMAIKSMNSVPSHLSRSIERLLEEAHLSGELNLNGRKLKEFPRTGGKYDLTDTVLADLSKNRFSELPVEVTKFWFLEKLKLYHNVIRSIPAAIVCLQSLTYLDLNRNLLTTLPGALCQLPLEILIVSNNKLVALPDEIGQCASLMDLDVSCNHIRHLPPQLGQLNALRSLNVRNNLLLELPIEITYLRLVQLDVSENRIATLPLELKSMTSLESLELNHNPLVSPPSSVCMRGRVHVFKYLALRSMKEDAQRSEDNRRCHRKLSELRARRNHTDSGYCSAAGLDWSSTTLNTASVAQLHNSDEGLNEIGKKRLGRSSSEREVGRSSSLRTNTSPAGIRCSRSSQPSIDSDKNGVSNGVDYGDTRPVHHMQSYKEYKEALKQQRAMDVYKSKTESKSNASPASPKKPGGLTPVSVPAVPVVPVSPVQLGADVVAKKPVQKVQPSRITKAESLDSPVIGDNVAYVKPSPPKTGANLSYPANVGVDGPPRPMWNRSNISPEKLSFTMRRELDRAKEEAQIISQLRSNIESRLKMALPSDLASALSDGVVLCHLANHVRPRSVASIHVPSPAVPKLTMARCRRNVDNFLDACRRIGVEENLLCCAGDVLEEKGLVQVAITVSELLKFHQPRSPAHSPYIVT